MSNHHKANRARPRVSPLYSWPGILFFAVVAFACVSILWVNYHAEQWRMADLRKWMSWPATPGSPVDTRIVEQPLTKTTFRGIRGKWYAGECLVAYSVLGKQYSVWVEARRSVDLRQLSDDMRSCPTRSYSVHYDPQEPSSAHAFVASTENRWSSAPSP
jgi:hypothetical protein